MIENLSCRCTRTHRSAKKLIQCAVGNIDMSVMGDGQFIYINFCQPIGKKPKSRRGVRIRLFDKQSDVTLRAIEDNVRGCGLYCTGASNHFIFRIDLDTPVRTG